LARKGLGGRLVASLPQSENIELLNKKKFAELKKLYKEKYLLENNELEEGTE